MSTLAAPRIVPDSVCFWSVSSGTGRRLFHDVARAARFILDEAFRLQGAGTLTIARLDEDVDETWNASSDVEDVLRASQWPENAAPKGTLEHVRLRGEVTILLEAILVTDSEPEAGEA